MRLHSDTITGLDIGKAAKEAGVRVIKCEPHGSRKRDHAFEVALSGRGNMGGMYGNLGYATALWDEWGIFLAALYRIDVDMAAGPYPHNRWDSYDSFDFATGERFQDLSPYEVHLRHKWTWAWGGEISTHGFVPGMAASFAVQTCKCGAARRWITSRVKALKASSGAV